jgi:hypothetical protein
MPIRIVADAEPWQEVVQDVRQRFGSKKSVHVGLYGHGAFVKPVELLKHDLPFIAALGLVGMMDVMILPQLQYPEKNPLRDIPRDALHALLDNPLKFPGDTLLGVARHKTQQLAAANRYATAHAAVRLATGLSAFRAQRMTPAVAAFSNSALVLVRIGQLLEQGTISDGDNTLSLAEDVRQGVYMTDVVTFGYPLPNGQVPVALSQRILGTFANVVPEQCWKQWGGNFPLRGEVENIPVPWAPAHNHWTRLHPRGPEVAALGTLFRGGDVAPRPHRGPQGAPQFWDVLCEQAQGSSPISEFMRH